MKSKVFWITGLSASGKTTLARGLVSKLKELGLSSVLLDGDELREFMTIDSSKNFSRNARLELAIKYSKLCKLLSDQGITVVIATISLFKEVHQWNRKNIDKYYEIFLDVPIDELMKRDPKKIYERFRNGEMKNVAGLDLKVDFPMSPDKTIVFDPKISNHEILNEIIVRNFNKEI